MSRLNLANCRTARVMAPLSIESESDWLEVACLIRGPSGGVWVLGSRNTAPSCMRPIWRPVREGATLTSHEPQAD